MNPGKIISQESPKMTVISNSPFAFAPILHTAPVERYLLGNTTQWGICKSEHNKAF